MLSSFAQIQRFSLAAVATALAGAGVPVAALGANPGGAAGPPSSIDTHAAGGAKPGSLRAPAPRRSSRSSRPSAPRARGPARVSAFTIASVRCVPVTACDGHPDHVSIRGTLVLSGSALRSGMAVVFARLPGRAGRGLRLPTATLRNTSSGLTATVPSSAHSGRIYAVSTHGRLSSSWGPLHVYRHALHPPAPALPPHPLQPGIAGAASGTAFDGQGMWIWYVSKSDGGDLNAIVNQAHASGVTTLYIKSSDGSANYWSQFTPALISAMHANGLKVCAWQYVYGSYPTAEADLGAQAVAAGADCLVIDAEAEYEGRYGAAQAYIRELRAKVGPTYPVGLASFPYVYYHPSEPYSVFLGPGGAQYNLPQMYWKDIGQSVDTVYANTFIHNRIYAREILPLGQTYNGVSTGDIQRFRAEASLYGASGLSFWDFQETTASGWAALATPLAPLTGVTPNGSYPTLASGNKGDEVLWMQEHLASAVPGQSTSGIFDAATVTNLQSFQQAHGIAVSGQTDAATWQALLALAPVAVDWTGNGAPTATGARRARAAAFAGRRPLSALLPARRYEIPAPGRAGRPG